MAIIRNDYQNSDKMKTIDYKNDNYHYNCIIVYQYFVKTLSVVLLLFLFLPVYNF